MVTLGSRQVVYSLCALYITYSESWLGFLALALDVLIIPCTCTSLHVICILYSVSNVGYGASENM